jgi:hypothetical protein
MAAKHFVIIIKSGEHQEVNGRVEALAIEMTSMPLIPSISISIKTTSGRRLCGKPLSCSRRSWLLLATISSSQSSIAFAFRKKLCRLTAMSSVSAMTTELRNLPAGLYIVVLKTASGFGDTG